MKMIDAEDGVTYLALKIIMIWKHALDEVNHFLQNTLVNPEFD